MKPATDTVPSALRAGGPEAPVTFRCWGTRGSIPSPGPATTRYGGNTSCFELRANGHRFVFDAGSGIRPLGLDLVKQDGVLDTPIFLTHFHWDHIQGFPFFLPLHQPGRELRILGPRQSDGDIRSLFERHMSPVYFPVPLSAVAADLSFAHLDEGPWQGHGVRVRALRVRHPSHTLGYRIEAEGRAVCFIPDDELEGGDYATDPGWRKRLVEFVGGADVLIHDSMYTDQEYPSRAGWGHSTLRQTLGLAEEGGVRKVLFFHHDPERSDAELDGIVSRLRDEAGARGSTVAMDAAAEGVEFTLGER